MVNLGLEYLSVFGLDPVAFIRLARELGLSSVGLNMNGASNALAKPADPGFRDDPKRRAEIVQALRDNGITLTLVEGFPVTPASTAGDFASDLDHLAEMGAQKLCCVIIDKDKMRAQAQFRQVAELAAERNLVVTTELGAGIARKLQSALDIAAAVNHPAFGLLIDTMHFFRSGSTIADFAAIDPSLVRHIQLCDVPMPAAIESYMEEALFERRAPGDGDLPLADLVAHIPAHATIGLEIPIRSEMQKGVPYKECLGRCLTQAKALWNG